MTETSHLAVGRVKLLHRRLLDRALDAGGNERGGSHLEESTLNLVLVCFMIRPRVNEAL
jgi:hypothetical protein